MNNMAHTRFHHQFILSAMACDHEVRALLRRMRKRLLEFGVCETTCASAELVLAEALNNITEHAYADRPGGTIEICTQIGPGVIRFTISDRGCALPGIRLPSGKLPNNNVPLEEMPEGGFGWFLIRDLTSSVTYEREGEENRLVLTLPNAQGS